jgi:hypothetical protein
VREGEGRREGGRTEGERREEGRGRREEGEDIPSEMRSWEGGMEDHKRQFVSGKVFTFLEISRINRKPARK